MHSLHNDGTFHPLLNLINARWWLCPCQNTLCQEATQNMTFNCLIYSVARVWCGIGILGEETWHFDWIRKFNSIIGHQLVLWSLKFIDFLFLRQVKWWVGVIIHILPEYFYLHQNRQKMIKKIPAFYKS